MYSIHASDQIISNFQKEISETKGKKVTETYKENICEKPLL
jgi:hypothetical protein